jgi:hypothetical protein
MESTPPSSSSTTNTSANETTAAVALSSDTAGSSPSSSSSRERRSYGNGGHNGIITPALARQQLAERYWPFVLHELSLIASVASLSITQTKDLHRLLSGYLLVVHSSLQAAADPKGDRGAKKGYLIIALQSSSSFYPTNRSMDVMFIGGKFGFT